MRPPANRIIRYEGVSLDTEIGPEHAQHLERIKAHVERHIGPVSRIIHEVFSKYVGVDILHVEPTASRVFHVLVTSGMSDRPMSAPAGAEDCCYAELSVCLPPDWPVTSADLKDERNYWPFRLLQTLARMPHVFGSWLWAFHTVPNFDPAEPYSKDTTLCGAMLVPSIRLPQEFAELEIGAGKQICFFDVLPLHADEMKYKVENGAEALLDHFDRAKHKGLIAPGRPSVLPAP